MIHSAKIYQLKKVSVGK